MPTAREPDAVASRRSEPTEFQRSEEDERVLSFPFSSEMPVSRGYLGEEVLDHSERSVDLSRLNDSAPLLWNHNPDVVLGVVERAWLDSEKRRGHVSVRFSRNEKAAQVLADINDGILRNVSTGYAVNDTEQGTGNQYRVTSWLPSEVSIVSCPADQTVGVGRALPKVDTSAQKDEGIMPVKAAAVATPPETQASTMTAATPDQGAIRAEIAEQCKKEERVRISEIRELCRAHRTEHLADDLISNNATADQSRVAVLDHLQSRPVETVKTTSADLSTQERQAYSVGAGIRAMVTGDWSSRSAGFVRELSEHCEQQGGISRTSANSFIIPFECFNRWDSRNYYEANRATYNTGTANVGGNLVATDLLSGDFIEALRNQSKLLQLGVQVMPGLVGDVAIPTHSGVGSTYWLSTETTAITQTSGTFGQVTMTPKNLGMLSKFTRQQVLQGSPSIDFILRQDIVKGMAVAADLAILNGSGSSGEPTGIMQTSGIGSVAMGTNGAAVTLEKIIDLETELSTNNGMVNPDSTAYLTNGKVVGALKKTRAGGSAAGDGPFLWNPDYSNGGRGPTPGTLNGYPIAFTNQVPSDLTKGTSSSVCSAMLMGDFSQCIQGIWGGGVEIMVGEDADDFSKALTSIRGIMSMDVCVRHAESFAAIKDITTA